MGNCFSTNFYELQYISSYVHFVRKKKVCMHFFLLFMKWVSQCCLSYKLVLVLIVSYMFCLLFLKCISQGFISASWFQFILRCLFQHLFARAVTVIGPNKQSCRQSAVAQELCSWQIFQSLKITGVSYLMFGNKVYAILM